MWLQASGRHVFSLLPVPRNSPRHVLAKAFTQILATKNEFKLRDGAFPVKGFKMTFPKWTKPGVYGAIVGAVAISIFGFNWGGWITGSKASDMAQELANKQVTQAMVPVCLSMAEADPNRTEKLAILQKASGFNRRNAIMETGWATRPGEDAPNRDLATACLAELDLNGS